MSQECQMVLEKQVSLREGPLDVSIYAPSQYCVDATRQADTSPFNGEARISNVGTAPVAIEHASGNIAFRAFRSTAVRAVAGVATTYSEPPLAPSDIEMATVTLAPGQTLVLRSWSRHQDVIETATIGAHKVQHFVVEYAYSFEADGVGISGRAETEVTARVR